MFSSTIVALASLTASALGAQIDVTVGGAGVIAYNPSSVTANVGDVVVFHFQQKNHTATQSTLANPCTHLDGGFDSGFVPVAADATAPFPVAQFTVKDTNPVWVYCKQTGHCGQGMVFAINPGNNFDTYKANAMATANGTSSATPSSTTGGATGAGTDHQVVVGGNGIIAFTPSQVTAQPGDTITFQFQQKNHTVTQSTFANPCGSNGGFNSGYMPVAATATTFPTYTIKVNDTTPIWAYCQQAGHCGQGMVFAANVNSSSPNSFAAFQAAAKASGGSSTSSYGGSSNTSSGTSSGTSGAANAAVSDRRISACGMIGLGLVAVFGMML